MHPEQSKRGNALGLAVQLERLDALDVDVVANETVRQLAEEHLAFAGRLLETRRRLDRTPVTSRWPVAASPATTSPVFTPMRFPSVTPYERCNPS